MSDPALIRAAVEASGLSARRFAERVMARDERTIRRWLNDADAVVPPIAAERLAWFVELTPAKRARLVALLDG